MTSIAIYQLNCRHSGPVQAHLFTLVPLTTTCIFILQEPHLRQGRVTSQPKSFVAFGQLRDAKCRTAILCHTALGPYVPTGGLHTHVLHVRLPRLAGNIISCYFPPKDTTTSPHLRRLTTQLQNNTHKGEWTLIGADANAYHESWGSRNDVEKTETVHSLQWSRGHEIAQWISVQEVMLLNDPRVATYCSDSGTLAAIDITLWKGTGKWDPPR